ncbi:MAG: aldo/keto reductase [Chlorobi bacterium]|nr:aldo/keto reductase [Chlorobiota bacterium]
MRKILLGSTGERISIFGLGTMYFGSKVDKKVSFRLMDIYEDHNGNFLDSANKYASWVSGFHGGESEAVLGSWLKSKHNRQKMLISSKVGFPYGNIPRSLKSDIIISECEKSLRRMGVETIDIYFAHAYDAETAIEETMEAFYHLKKEGKIRFAGASNFPAWRMEEANNLARQKGWEGFCCLQQRHSYLEPNVRTAFGNQLLITPETEDFALTKNITLMGYSPLLNGSYVREDRKLPEQYNSLNTDIRLKALRRVAGELNASPNQVVLSWMIHSNPVVIPLVTGSNESQIRENLNALKFHLSDDHLKILNNLDATQYELLENN